VGDGITIQSKSYSVQLYIEQSDCMRSTKVHPGTSNKLDESNVEKVRLRGTSEGACESVSVILTASVPKIIINDTVIFLKLQLAFW